MMGVPAKIANVDGYGHTKVSSAANSDLETTLLIDPNPSAVPPSALSARRHLIIAFPTDIIYLGNASVSDTTGYGVRGRKGESGWSGQSALSDYSNRKQFLRGQYTALAISDDLALYARITGGALEDVVAFEFA
jgi:hypothetical protein